LIQFEDDPEEIPGAGGHFADPAGANSRRTSRPRRGYGLQGLLHPHGVGACEYLNRFPKEKQQRRQQDDLPGNGRRVVWGSGANAAGIPGHAVQHGEKN
jgi:hypothetical protein